MIKLKFNLPPYRLSVNLRMTKRRRFSWRRTIKASFGRVQELEPREVRRFIARLFAHKSVKNILGTNLALMLIATSFLPARGLTNVQAEESVIPEAQTVLTTEIATQYPIETVRITQGYAFYHPGIDLDGITGDLIRPIKKGYIKEISHSKFAYGNSIIVDHGNEVTSLYAHLSEVDVKDGQEVTTDTIIGKMGATGRAFGDHLHLEIRDHGRSVNPTTVLPR